MSYTSLREQVVLVTGASSGLGRAIALELSRQGCRVALVGRRQEELARTLHQMEGEGHQLFPWDLSQLDALPELMQQIVAQMGSVDKLVHAAGLHATQPIRILSTEDTQKLYTTNVFAFMFLVKAFRNKRIPKREPSVVALSSVVGTVGQPGVSTYAGTKGALESTIRSFALELAAEGIRVNAVAPGIVQTEMTDQLRKQVGDEQYAKIASLHPLGLGRPEDVAHAVAFLLAQESRWMTGTTLTIDGGYTAQ
ncbi:SDR family NAD(P)-dependent oxidoreductase [Deinococcus cellulosilyticus]|uniref:Oxidoreductase n=1 Tax=Deinococcus cellulosilyticus (strain DSM 18568 / NBRC 106333 / KACC 11606 / 5516J-15) TaxID=1223518 RepID=A0A511N409_DEIC1|nr:SDR family oxidoreductase [Deinococcus cellulosilyticus]GEM47600.1 oxidoreductase [Deinococcus cellulosilyticus NBRC 106333 = KACC 11606]